MKKEKKIIILTNPLCFFLRCVFIVTQKNSFRLVVIHNQRILTDEIYKTARGAKIAFSKMYGFKVLKVGAKAEWKRYNPNH